jgi:hypothetical protein
MKGQFLKGTGPLAMEGEFLRNVIEAYGRAHSTPRHPVERFGLSTVALRCKRSFSSFKRLSMPTNSGCIILSFDNLPTGKRRAPQVHVPDRLSELRYFSPSLSLS